MHWLWRLVRLLFIWFFSGYHISLRKTSRQAWLDQSPSVISFRPLGYSALADAVGEQCHRLPLLVSTSTTLKTMEAK